MYFINFFFILTSLFAHMEENKPFVVVELFTSEGCSSCPSADRLLSELVEQETSEVEIIGLSFHVDYWDYIGWKDPYASKEFTNRQRTYAQKFYSNQVYTPQMVVNGRYEFVGSDRTKWKKVWSAEKRRPNKHSMNLKVTQLNKGRLTVNVASTFQEKAILNVAIVERGLEQRVTRGENRGRNLSHDNVVRVFKTEPLLTEENNVELILPEGLARENSSIVAYIQKESSWVVTAAKKLKLPSLK